MTERSTPVDARGPWQIATVVAIEASTPRIKTFTMRLSHRFDFQPGQHVDIRLTAADGYRATRSYSIASSPGSRDTIELAVERLDDGEVSPFLHDVVVPGDDIELRGPLGGHFIWPAGDQHALLLAGGGSGIVPLISMVRHRRAVADPRPVLLLYSVRTSADMLYPAELFELDGRRDGFELVLALTREVPARQGDYGRRVDAAMLSEVVARLPNALGAAFVCGSNGFVNAVADGAIDAGIAASAIRTERYGG